MNLRAVLTLLGLLAVAGCASDDNQFYRHSPSMEPLEIPPDLTKPTINDTYQVPEVGSVLLATPLKGQEARVRLVRDGSVRWLEMQADREVVWRRVREYWLSHDAQLDWENRDLGVMETQWLPHYKSSQFARDKFRVRIEPGRNKDSSEIYITHQGVQQQFLGDVTVSVWSKRPNDPELEIEVLGQMLEYLGLSTKRSKEIQDEASKKSVTVTLATDDTPSLVLQGEREAAIKRLELAIDRLGHLIVKRDADKSLIVVDTQQKGGFLPGFAEVEDGSDVYQLHYADVKDGVQITVQLKNGEADRSRLAVERLSELYEKVNK